MGKLSANLLGKTFKYSFRTIASTQQPQTVISSARPIQNSFLTSKIGIKIAGLLLTRFCNFLQLASRAEVRYGIQNPVQCWESVQNGRGAVLQEICVEICGIPVLKVLQESCRPIYVPSYDNFELMLQKHLYRVVTFNLYEGWIFLSRLLYECFKPG